MVLKAGFEPATLGDLIGKSPFSFCRSLEMAWCFEKTKACRRNVLFAPLKQQVMIDERRRHAYVSRCLIGVQTPA